MLMRRSSGRLVVAELGRELVAAPGRWVAPAACGAPVATAAAGTVSPNWLVILVVPIRAGKDSAAANAELSSAVLAAPRCAAAPSLSTAIAATSLPAGVGPGWLASPTLMPT